MPKITLTQLTKNQTPITLIDNLEPNEHTAEHIPNSINLLQSTISKASTAHLSKQTPTVFYCRNGNRTTKSKELLESLGFETTYTLEKGIEARKAQGGKVVSH